MQRRNPKPAKKRAGVRPTSTWKNHERATANKFGTNRIPMSGALASLKTHSDTFHEKLYIECKYSKQAFDLLYRQYKEAKNKIPKTSRKLPAVILKRKGRRRPLLFIHDSHIAREYIYPQHFAVQEYESHTFAVYTLYTDTCKKARVEGKIPCLSIKKKGSVGCMLGFFTEDFKTIQKYYNGE